jgi:DNA-binding NtrC family response regulator
MWISESDFPARVRAVVSAGSHPRRPTEQIQLDDFLQEVERELIARAMKRSRGNKAKAARLLGVSRPRLLRRLTQLGFEVPSGPEIDFQPVEDDAPFHEDSGPEK